MKMNKMTSYAIRIIGRLCQNKKELITSTQLVQGEGIPLGAVMKILIRLKEEGIVESKRGRGSSTGGFLLKKDMGEFTLYDLVYAMEGEIYLCPEQDKNAYKGDKRLLYEELERISHIYIEELRSNSIQSLLTEKTKKRYEYHTNIG